MASFQKIMTNMAKPIFAEENSKMIRAMFKKPIAFKHITGKSDQFVPTTVKETVKQGSKGIKQKIAEMLEKAIEVAKRTKGF